MHLDNDPGRGQQLRWACGSRFMQPPLLVASITSILLLTISCCHVFQQNTHLAKCGQESPGNAHMETTNFKNGLPEVSDISFLDFQDNQDNPDNSEDHDSHKDHDNQDNQVRLAHL